jgi:hypothetical protein
MTSKQNPSGVEHSTAVPPRNHQKRPNKSLRISNLPPLLVGCLFGFYRKKTSEHNRSKKHCTLFCILLYLKIILLKNYRILVLCFIQNSHGCVSTFADECVRVRICLYLYLYLSVVRARVCVCVCLCVFVAVVFSPVITVSTSNALSDIKADVVSVMIK